MGIAKNFPRWLAVGCAAQLVVICATLLVVRGGVQIDSVTQAALFAALGLSLVASISAAAGIRKTSARNEVRANLATQQRLRGIIEETGMGFWETEIGSDQVFISDTYAKLLGLERDANDPMSMAEWFALIHPADAQRIGEAIVEVGETLAGSALYRLEYRALHTSGRHVWVLSLGAVAKRHADGKPFLVVGTLTDITEQKQVQLALAASERSFRSLFEQVPVGIALTDLHSRRFLQANNALVESIGYTHEELLGGMTFDQLARTAEGSSLDQSIGQREREFVRKDGTVFSALVSGSKSETAEGQEVIWTVIHDISERKAAERQLTFAANCDRLTGLANRAQFVERLKESIARIRGGAQDRVGVLFLDFDRFKIVNDAMGHLAGDKLLVQIGLRLRSVLRQTDFDGNLEGQNQIARFGGDEFLIVLNDIKSSQDAIEMSDRVQDALARPYYIQGREVQCTASIGIVISNSGSETADAMIRNADVAMYEAKREGRSRAVLFDQSMHNRRTRYLALEYGLRQALANNELSLNYQSIFDLQTGKRTSVEALLRWNHPEFGVVSPTEFIPIAEECGQIIPIGAWVLSEGLAALARLQAADPARAPQCVSVNVSRTELARDGRLMENVSAALAQSGLPPSCLQLEVTEREVMRDPESSLRVMRELRGLGVRLAMDDFGTGTSSLSCLANYPFDVIKIDRSFIQHVSELPEAQVVVRAAVALVENLGRRSVAEGIETPEQFMLLQHLGCHQAQGYFLGMPLPEDQVIYNGLVEPQVQPQLRKQG